jgi:hypothetical protein
VGVGPTPNPNPNPNPNPKFIILFKIFFLKYNIKYF